ncbi:hypothetical protein [Enterobacter mori]|jgi:hypothetical protein|uniref:hypothetical protein n=1 Tax=Enterobacter mori TaxID=539813 RepID=UPI001F213C13|nr:hypothetical protein [Enterobacter mori]MCO7360241.1 hypothetical protein [Enterobacter mori]MEE4405133.1 hypothetical protein [Enterobacter mori]
MKRLTQREALEMGLARFYTGKKCIHGHDSERYTLSGEQQRAGAPPAAAALRENERG